MGSSTIQGSLDGRIAARLVAMRRERGWALDELASRSGVSRASLSRIENGEVSPTASSLGRICAAFETTLSRLIYLVDGAFEARVAPERQPVFTDAAYGFTRRSVSPPAHELSGEVLECRIEPAQAISYDRPPRPGLEHHLLLLEGALSVTVEGMVHRLGPGDCLRYRLHGASRFETPAGQSARYLLFMV